jgi:hypothetical protein
LGPIRGKPDRLLKGRYAGLRFTQEQARFAEMKLGSGVVRVQRYRRLEFALGLI